MKDLITEARELCKRATQGEWTAEPMTSKKARRYGNPRQYKVTLGKVFENIALYLSKEDAQLFARSRTLIPELCDALEKATAKNDELIRELSELARESGCVYCINCPEKIIAKKERYSHATETGIAYDNIKVNFCPMCGKRLEEHHEAN